MLLTYIGARAAAVNVVGDLQVCQHAHVCVMLFDWDCDDAGADPLEIEVDVRATYLEACNLDALDPDRQGRSADMDFSIDAVDLDAQQRLKQHEDRAGSPGLR